MLGIGTRQIDKTGRVEVNNLKPWFPEDILALLRAVVIGARNSDNPDYQQGFIDCAVAIVIALGGRREDLTR